MTDHWADKQKNKQANKQKTKIMGGGGGNCPPSPVVLHLYSSKVRKSLLI